MLWGVPLYAEGALFLLSRKAMARRAMARTCSRGHRFPCRPLFHNSSKVPPADILSRCAKSALLPPENSSVAKWSPRKT